MIVAQVRAAQQVTACEENHAKAVLAEETARRTDADDAVLGQAIYRAAGAASYLEAARVALAEAEAERIQAEGPAEAAERLATAAEATLDQARAQVKNPGRIPRSELTISIDLPAVGQAPDLTDVEKEMVRNAAEALAALTGAHDDITSAAVAKHKLDRANAAKNARTFTTPLGNGMAAAWANPGVKPGLV